ncbi:unnamed protein product [Rangifer tarandus platyrhynchus]|uniref:Uncharacterized protein n=2 Tax=Rangifer tarandus platyrhynchus TaxID=3082113 RepID=A0AC59ZKT2_RANTA|nr:unnamed protein product [Rangifer tarandus platyrhynchus]
MTCSASESGDESLCPPPPRCRVDCLTSHLGEEKRSRTPRCRPMGAGSRDSPLVRLRKGGDLCPVPPTGSRLGRGGNGGPGNLGNLPNCTRVVSNGDKICTLVPV